ncbi:MULTISPECIES: RrF2 family transcriptional regulator [unclassified Bacillus (in: firmicutes)]|uniref:RrF2 family transcriptional regulator n=1 Tax=unclassified Bacillus (in: firmicutes) TaxID=185979 RepID=UPI000E35F2D6|nr:MULTISPECIES: Rrf2 family transcriptional regulator [unclassified Bacillus (in: firmicutes)]AXR20277.1 Rrf2 family transcriptional regulator [Bacillus sp. CR71]AXR26016.1 Rrf2 family transcriptional regulator [Bacillus sp. E25]
MNYSKGTNYALHTTLHLAKADNKTLLSVHELAAKESVSATYLSKILTKLTKYGLIESVSGAQGGYRLKKSKYDITFLDIIHAVEGTAPLFKSCESNDPECLIEAVMKEAEKQMNDYLNNKTIGEIADILQNNEV